MHARLLAAAAVLLLAGSAGAAPASDPPLMAPIKGFDDAVNTGKPLDSFLAPGPQAVIDDFAPHRWVGAGAIKAWYADFAVFCRKQGITQPWVKAGPASHVEQDASHAYVVIPAVFTFRLKGKPQREEGTMTLALDRSSSGWKIAAFSWAAGRRG